jgi:multiple sugar transport system substrate-binding protein
VLGGQNLAVARSSDQPRAAQALIEFLTGERSQQILFEHGGFAATRGIVYQDANITTKYPYATTLLEAIRRAKKRPVTPHYTSFSLEFRKVVAEVWANDGEITAEHARRLTEALQGKTGG